MSDKISSKSASISAISDAETEGSQGSRSPSKLKFILSIVIINLSDRIIIITSKLGQDGNLQCGLIRLVDDLPMPVPLKNVHIDAKVVDFISQVTITQEYVNHESGNTRHLFFCDNNLNFLRRAT